MIATASSVTYEVNEDVSLDPNIASGFTEGYEAEEILGCTNFNDQILFLIKW